MRRKLFPTLAFPLLMAAAGCATGNLSSRATGNLAEFVSDEDYPDSAIRAGAQGTVGFMLDIAADGHVTRCKVEQSSGNATLDETTCRVMMARAHLTPAKDRKGRPTTDTIRSRMRWVMPEPNDGVGQQETPQPPSV